ncbi:MAG: hypothetical protein ACRDYA_05670 [Egibacteraceae bacterium]
MGEELRALLLRALSEGEVGRLRGLPWGIGAAFRQGEGVPSAGPPGVFFACRTRGGQRYWRFVEDGDTVVDTEATILRRINPAPLLVWICRRGRSISRDGGRLPPHTSSRSTTPAPTREPTRSGSAPRSGPP